MTADEAIEISSDGKHIIIHDKPQDNGLWGTPMNLMAIEGDFLFFQLDEKTRLLESAIVFAIGMRYWGERWKIFWSNEEGFFIKLSHSGMKRIRYKDYKLEGNKLSYIQ